MGVDFLKMGVIFFENGSWKRGWHVQVQDYYPGAKAPKHIYTPGWRRELC